MYICAKTFCVFYPIDYCIIFWARAIFSQARPHEESINEICLYEQLFDKEKKFGKKLKTEQNRKNRANTLQEAEQSKSEILKTIIDITKLPNYSA